MLRGRHFKTALACAGALAALTAFYSAALAQNAGVGGPTASVEILSQGPGPELRFRGLKLKNVRADDAQNEILLTFEDAVDPAVFDALEQDLPDWIEKSYAGYDSAIIHTRQPTTFMTRREGDGFSLRLIPRGPSPPPMADNLPVPLRGRTDDANRISHLAPAPVIPAALPPEMEMGLRGSLNSTSRYYSQSLTQRPRSVALQQALDRSVAGTGSYIAGGSTYFRTPDRDTVIASNLHGKLQIASALSIVGSYDNTWAEGNAVRRLNGTRSPFDKNVSTGAAGLAFDLDGSEIRGEALFGQSGPGARLTAYSGTANGFVRLSGEYRAPELGSAEAIAAKAVRDRAEIGFAQILDDGVWGSLAARLTRYGVTGDSNIARTAGFSANFEIGSDVYGVLAGLFYDAEGEYVIDRDVYAGPPAFTPLSIRDREIHQGGFKINWPAFDRLWLDMNGGYAYERYSATGGFFGGAGLRYSFAPGVDLNLWGRYTEVSTNLGAVGPETSAGLALTFALGNTKLGFPTFE